MFTYLLRRLSALVVVLLGASFLIYNLTAIAGDPLEDLRLSDAENKEYLIAQRTADLQLDVPPPIRYFLWLGRLMGIFVGNLDLGMNREGTTVLSNLELALPTTIRLVITATLLAVVIGITIGVITALRQYSRFDYSITFLSFLLYSLPIFWVAVLLKQFMAIGFNDFLYDPVITPIAMVIIGLILGLIVAGFIGGSRKTFLLTFGAASVGSGLLVAYLSAIDWFRNPGLGPILILLIGGAIAVAITVVSTGLKNRGALYASLTMAVLGLIAYFAMAPIFDSGFGNKMLLLFAVITILAGLAAGWFFGGQDKGPVMRTSAISAFLIGGVVLLDRYMQSWNEYYNNEWINGRPIATVGEKTTDITGDYWIQNIDAFTHLMLPTLALMLISFATYTRYSRGSLLEVMNQDYIRTARAKGLTERTVVMRHAFRNALIPLTTIMAFDFGGIVGGAIITESVFGWQGMGTLFNHGLGGTDLNTVMGVFLVTSISALLFNLFADLVYSALDPRIRVNK